MLKKLQKSIGGYIVRYIAQLQAAVLLSCVGVLFLPYLLLSKEGEELEKDPSRSPGLSPGGYLARTQISVRSMIITQNCDRVNIKLCYMKHKFMFSVIIKVRGGVYEISKGQRSQRR